MNALVLSSISDWSEVTETGPMFAFHSRSERIRVLLDISTQRSRVRDVDLSGLLVHSARLGHQNIVRYLFPLMDERDKGEEVGILA